MVRGALVRVGGVPQVRVRCVLCGAMRNGEGLG